MDPADVPQEREESPDSSDQKEFSLTIDESGPKFDYWRIGAGVVAGLAIIGIILFSVTDLSSFILPMEDEYLQVLVPETEDGSEPFVLNELSERTEGNSLSIAGRMTNRSIEDVENVVAVIAVRDTTGRFPAAIRVPVDPSPLRAGESGSFSLSVTLREKPDSYTLRFELEDGPPVPHADERNRSLEFEVAPRP